VTVTTGDPASFAGGRLRKSRIPATVWHYFVWGIAIVLIIGPVLPIVWASFWSTPLYDTGG
jgi:iron(III) transport system permease protein